MSWLCTGVFWAVAVAIVVATVRGRRQKRFHYRWTRGLCVRCGYDLRESRGVCPECGLPIPERLDPKRVRQDALFWRAEGPTVLLMDPEPIFETFREMEAKILVRELMLSGVPADRVVFVNRRYARVIGYRVRVDAASLPIAVAIKKRLLR